MNIKIDSRKMRNIKGLSNRLPTGTEDCYRAFSFGNINTYCVHVHKNVTPSFGLQLVSASFTHCPFNLLWCDTNAPERWINLHKTNAANEELVSRLFCGREVQGGFRYTDCSYHSNSLSNKMDNSLLAVRDINHKYIVVGGVSQNVYAARRKRHIHHPAEFY